MTSPAGPRLASPDGLVWKPRFEYGEMAELAEVSGTVDDTPLGTGFARMSGARIPWTIRYDEILLVLEGRVTVHAAGERINAEPHQAIWLPGGTELVYEAEDALVFYAIHPADWAEREET